MQTNRLYILFIAFASLVSYSSSFSQEKDSIASLPSLDKDFTITNDSIPQNVSVENDTLAKSDSIPAKKEAIQFIIEHAAEDYIHEDVINKRVKLYNQAHVVYDEYDIVSGQMLIDYQTNTVVAKGIPDEDGKYSQLPVFKTKANETTQDSLIFNYKTKKAIIYGLETEQDGINTLGEKTKRVNDSTIFVRNIIFTTSDPRNPDYYLKTTKAKVVPGKKIITGPTNLVLADVPTPLIFPFAYFPLTKKRTSGIIFPTYGESYNQGFFLQNGGYYLAISDYFDLKLTADIYSNSSWGFNAASSYKVRYKFSGQFEFNYDNLITGIEGFSNYSEQKNFNLRWSHSQDSKASPNNRFTASVNLGSSQYFRQSVNESNTGNALNNTLSSSISYYKKFVGTPFNMTLGATHRQNTNTQIVTATLPSLQLNMDRLQPFAPKSGTAKNALQKIGLNYSFKAENRVEALEDEFFSGAILDKAKNGAQHNVSLSTNMKVLKYFSLSPNLTYREVWYTKKINKEYDPVAEEIVTDTLSGFNAFRDYSTSASLSTTVYGMYGFKGKKLKAIRHTMRPSISYSYKPDFGFYYDEIQRNAEGETQTYSQFEGGIYGQPSTGITNAVSFSLANSLEAKVADPESLEGEDKKINLLNSLNLSTAYNFAAESFKLSNFNLTAGTTLFKKMNINMGATLDPYDLDENGRRVDRMSYKNGGPLVRLTSARFSTGYSFSSKDFDKKKNGQKTEEETTPLDQDMFGQNLSNTNDFQHEEESDEAGAKKEKDKNLPQYVSSMPWNIRFSYSTNYTNSNGNGRVTGNSLTVSGDVELSPGWKVGASSGYDFVNNGITYTNLRFSRDLSSWSMNFNWVPLGNNSSYYFFIGVKSSVLSDLKWDKRNVNRDF
ncbi:putative LPS assembly protein LptD [Ochrovirga pacifica]|uniref:putative LPS assembly protein LptD n=1 Tax=Ochrovirga pacifica TaxID=1042376 RepID=UPI000255A504|nr:putative LPS assembly protein LptD [Ochrovirga pacifica]